MSIASELPASPAAPAILWRRIDQPGHEISRLIERPGGSEIVGTAVFAHDGRPCRLDYSVTCDAAWVTTGASVSGEIGERHVDLGVSVEGGNWLVNGAEAAAVRGCLDIDLAFSPSTNLLPIRRLRLGVGGERAVRAAWLRFPSMEFAVLEQVYRREGPSDYHYESAGGRFQRTLEVNVAGFVVRYPGIWEAETV